MRTCSGILLLAFLGSQAGALCNLPRPRLVCAEYFHSQAVVIARLAGVTPVKDSYGDITGTYYSLTVEQTFRGQVPRLFRVYEDSGKGRATVDWKTGGSYLLFLLREDPNGSWVIDGCGNSGLAETKESALHQIKTLDATSNHAQIHGLVWDTSIPGPVAGVQIEAQGPGGVTSTQTETNGRFELRVAPGKYQVQARSPGKTFLASDLTYENPDDLVLENGACAQVQFVESSEKH